MEYRTFEKFSGKEELLSEEDFEQYSSRPAWIIEGNILTDAEQAGKLYQQLVEMKQMEQMQQAQQMQAMGYDEKAQLPEVEVNAEQITYADLLEQGQIDVVKVTLSDSIMVGLLTVSN